jgi:hypothetical protein
VEVDVGWDGGMGLDARDRDRLVHAVHLGFG